jgi:AraC-like DNA-binding protein
VTSILIAILIFADLALLIVMFKLHGRQKANEASISDLTDERFLLKEMHLALRSEMSTAEARQRELLNRFTQLAAEAEQEVGRINSSVASSIESIQGQVASRFESPLKELAQRQGALELLLKKFKSERESIERSIRRGEELTAFFGKTNNHQDVLTDIQNKRHEDARALLNSGNSVEAVARRLGLPRSEVELVKKFIHSGL